MGHVTLEIQSDYHAAIPVAFAIRCAVIAAVFFGEGSFGVAPLEGT